MTCRIIILGANGQVAAEVALLLVAAGADVIPVCRSRRGSAFLRQRGIAVRHGAIECAEDAPRLVGDGDVIASFALAGGTPRAMRDANDRIIAHAVGFSPPRAVHVFFSTLAVLPDFVPAGARPASTAYGREKLRNERTVMRLARVNRRAALVLRLGHVTGRFQGISEAMSRLIAEGAVALPDPERLANCTATASIAAALLEIARRPPTGVELFDLVDTPPRSWRAVLEGEARRHGSMLEIVATATGPATSGGLPNELAAAAFGLAGRSSPLRNQASRLLGLLPQRINRAARARHLVAQARRAIAQLRAAPRTLETFNYPAMPTRALPLSTVPCDSDAAIDALDLPSWPADLPDAALAQAI